MWLIGGSGLGSEGEEENFSLAQSFGDIFVLVRSVNRIPLYDKGQGSVVAFLPDPQTLSGSMIY